MSLANQSLGSELVQELGFFSAFYEIFAASVSFFKYVKEFIVYASCSRTILPKLNAVAAIFTSI